jgi:peptidoglycan/LPS O-acetylase OafA/YrhL
MKQPIYRFVPEVEALRGLAALAVVHVHTIGDTNGKPLNVLVNGSGAVILFFVMSGFALATQIRHDVPGWQSYRSFIVRRLFRLMPIVWLSIALAAVIHVAAHKTPSFDPEELISNALLYNFSLNAPLWSLYVELWCSVVFPLLFWLWRYFAIAGRAALLVMLILPIALLPADIAASILIKWSLYLFCFALGLFAAEYRDSFAGTPPLAMGILVLGCALIAGSAGYWIESPGGIIVTQAFSYAVLLAVVLKASDEGLFAFLRLRSIKFLGMISFSLYALHYPLMEALWPTVTHNVGLSLWHDALFVALVCTAVPVAYLTFSRIERPLNDVGKKLSNRLAVR